MDIRELAEDLARAGSTFLNPGEGFDCRCCGMRFVPVEGQWIFYNLCDLCFVVFDEQKMQGRFGRIGWGPPLPEGAVYYESCEAWLRSSFCDHTGRTSEGWKEKFRREVGSGEA